MSSSSSPPSPPSPPGEGTREVTREDTREGTSDGTREDTSEITRLRIDDVVEAIRLVRVRYETAKVCGARQRQFLTRRANAVCEAFIAFFNTRIGDFDSASFRRACTESSGFIPGEGGNDDGKPS